MLRDIGLLKIFLQVLDIYLLSLFYLVIAFYFLFLYDFHKTGEKH